MRKAILLRNHGEGHDFVNWCSRNKFACPVECESTVCLSGGMRKHFNYIQASGFDKPHTRSGFLFKSHSRMGPEIAEILPRFFRDFKMSKPFVFKGFLHITRDFAENFFARIREEFLNF